MANYQQAGELSKVSPEFISASLSGMSPDSNCALCAQAGLLRWSHVIPEFLYLPIYDDKHRFQQVSTNPATKILLHQKGLREKLLCGSCEGRLGQWESYAKKVLYGGIKLEYRDIQGGCVISQIDYTMFKLFGMSLLWRAGVSRLAEFSGVQLGPHEEKLRIMILENSPGRYWEYGFSVLFPPGRDAKEAFGKTLILPDGARYGAHHVYRFFLGTTSWVFLVSNHTQQIDQKIFSLSEDGQLLLRSGGKPMMDFLVRFSTDIAAATAKREGQELIIKPGASADAHLEESDNVRR